MEPESERIVSVDQLPDNPLEMPPPYWRSSGATFCLLGAAETIVQLLEELVPVHERTQVELEAHFEKYPEGARTDEEVEEFFEIIDELLGLESRIGANVMVAILMSAIEAEDRINQFCVYNLHKDVAESIEKLSPPDKLLVAAVAMGEELERGNAVYADIKALTQWRNAFAHGHCVDRPTRSLRHNHLIPPDKYPDTVSHLAELRRLVPAYTRISDYLGSISRNSYLAGESYEVERIKEMLSEIGRYRFTGNDNVYSIVVAEPES